jgi:hypothetical protein
MYLERASQAGDYCDGSIATGRRTAASGSTLTRNVVASLILRQHGQKILQPHPISRRGLQRLARADLALLRRNEIRLRPSFDL